MQQFVDYFLKNLYTIFYIYSQIHHAMTKIILKRPLLESEKGCFRENSDKRVGRVRTFLSGQCLMGENG